MSISLAHSAPSPTIAGEFLRRLGHPVALIGRKPIGNAPKSQIIWPADQTDPIDHACYLSRNYHAVYCNLNPLESYMLDCVPDRGRSVNDRMIARHTRLLIDVDSHDVPKDVAREQKDAIKAIYGPPLIETDSGNGFGLIYAIDLPNDHDSRERVSAFLAQLKERFACVDSSTANAGRLTRVIGTLNRSVTDGSRIETTVLA